MIGRTTAALLLAAGIAAAQQGAIEDAIRKQAEEVSRLMRESERLLLEITRVDRLVETQKQIEEDLKKLIPPEQGSGAAGEEERGRQREQLQAKQAEVRRHLEEMLAGQKENASLTVKQLEELLKTMPKEPVGGSGGESQKPPTQEEREKRLQDKQEERKQHQPEAPRKPEDDPKNPKQRSDKRKPPENPADARRTRVEAWIAKLPPEEQDRINRNDFSRIPGRYRRLVEEYTAQRAKREAEKQSDTER